MSQILCSTCGDTFYAPNVYIEHYQKNHGGLPPEYADKEKHVCNDCSNVYISIRALNSHQRNVHSEIKPSKKPKKCGFCDKIVINLRGHILKQHKKDTPYKCTQCSYTCVTNGHLRSHIKKKHTRVNCDVCSLEICNDFMLKRHKAKVHGMIPDDSSQCPHCPMFFKTKGHMDKHMIKVHQYVAV